MALTFGLLSTVPLQEPWATVCSLTCSKIVDFYDSYLNKGSFKDLGGFLSFLNRDAEGMCKLRETLVCFYFFLPCDENGGDASKKMQLTNYKSIFDFFFTYTIIILIKSCFFSSNPWTSK